MQPLPTERVLIESPGHLDLVLTSHRVRLDVKKWGEVETISIMLDELASCGIKGNSHPGLLVLSPLLLIAGLGSGIAAAGVLGVGAALAMIVLYFATRHRDLLLTSSGDSIRVPITRLMSVEAAISFIDSVEKAKDLRYVFRHSNTP